MNRTERLRQRAQELLKNGEVTVVLGFGPKSVRGINQPLFCTDLKQAQQLVLEPGCPPNLANYLLKLKGKGKIATVARGCEARSITVLLQENQLLREDLYILGVGCEGFWENGKKAVACATCQYPNPLLYDEMIGEPVAETNPQSPIREADENFAQLSPDERWEILSEDLRRCLRCYACRQVCPNCYCPVCFVDASIPQLVGKTSNLSDNFVFHIIRALHMAGRCVECGACHNACPVGIDLMAFNRRVARIVKERFNCLAGTDLNQPPALSWFAPEDPQEFIK